MAGGSVFARARKRVKNGQICRQSDRRQRKRVLAGQDCGKEANISKLLAAEASWEAAEAAMQTFGGFSFAEEYNIERKFRETRLYQIAPISTNMIYAYIAHKVLGFPRSY